jgi:DNA-binding LacI/PurR family transcriptional regulator
VDLCHNNLRNEPGPRLGTVKPTQHSVAVRAGVSRALVSLVMREAPNVSTESRHRILRAAEELGYRPNAFARSLASKRVQTIGVLVNDVSNPYFGSLYASLAKAASAVGYDILTAPGTRSAQKERGLINTLLEHQVAGLALLSPLLRTTDLQPLIGGVPTVIVGRTTSIPGVDVVTTDEDQAARLVISHLNALGHTDIAHISGGSNRPATDRAKGYQRVMREFDLPARMVTGSFTERGGQLGIARILAAGRLPTAIVAANDLCAVGAIGALNASGIQVPGDISVVGYDDSQIAQLDLVRLTSVRQPIDQFGPVAVDTLLRRFESPDLGRSVRRIGATLAVRATTAAAVPLGGA